ALRILHAQRLLRLVELNSWTPGRWSWVILSWLLAVRRSRATFKRTQHRVVVFGQNPVILGTMSTRRRKTSLRPSADAFFAVKRRKTVPHEFVLEALSALSPLT